MGKKIVNVLKWVWLAVVIVGAAYYFSRNYQEVSQYLKTVSIPRLVLGFLAVLISRLFQSDFTRTSVKKAGVFLSFKDALAISSMTQMGKYLPGGVWQFASKFGVYHLRGIDSKTSTKVMVLENLWLVVSSFVMGVVILLGTSFELSNQILNEYFNFQLSNTYRIVIIIALLVLWIALLFVFEKILFKDEKIIVKDIAVDFVEQIGLWLTSGISLWLVFPHEFSQLFSQVVGAFCISWLAGFIIFFASGGIGIRELMLTIFLSSLVPGEQIVIFATIHRLLWIIADFALGLISSSYLKLDPEKASTQVDSQSID